MRGKGESKYYWLEVTKDEYQLPLVVADSCEELAEICKVPTSKIFNYASRTDSGELKPKYIKVRKECHERI